MLPKITKTSSNGNANGLTVASHSIISRCISCMVLQDLRLSIILE